MALHLPIGSLNIRSGLEPVPRCEPSTYQPISRWLSHCAIGAGMNRSGKRAHFEIWNVVRRAESVCVCVCTYNHTYIYTYIMHTYIYTCMHTYIHIYIQTDRHTYILLHKYQGQGEEVGARTCSLDVTQLVTHPYDGQGRKEGNVLFNDALNTVIWRRTYGKVPLR